MIDRNKLKEQLAQSIVLADALKAGWAKLHALHPGLGKQSQKSYADYGTIILPLEKPLRDYWLSLAADEFRPIVAVIRAAQSESPSERGKDTIEKYSRDLNIEPRGELIDFLLRKGGILADHLQRGRQYFQL